MLNVKTDHRNTEKSVLIHLISHNHWDREWIFTARFANRWLPPFFSNLISLSIQKPSEID